MRKILVLLIFALLLAGCGAAQEAPTEFTNPIPVIATTAATEPPATEPPVTVTEPPATEPEPVDPVLTLLDAMTLEQKLGQLFIVTPEQLSGSWNITEMDDTLAEGLIEIPVGGIIYFADNLRNREQTESLLSGLDEASEIPLFHCVDEEGGTVCRIGSNSQMETTKFPPMMDIENAEDAYTVGMTIGSEIRKLGFNVDFAPVADVMTNPYNTVIGSRAFSTDPEIAAEQVAAAAAGFRGSGIICCLKHFPGHGNTDTDSHYGYACSYRSLQELENCEFLPFIAGMDAGAPMVMVGHICVPEIDDAPATLSYPLVTEILRERLGFDGLCITDSLQMGAITGQYTSGEAAVAAIAAGIDILLMPADLESAYQALLDAVENGELTEDRINESVLRILRCKEQYGILSFSEDP